MGTGIAALIASIVSALVSSGIGIGKSVKQKNEKVEVDEYQKKAQRYEEMQKKRQEREAGRAALARAIGSDLVFAPRPGEEAPEAPAAGDYSGFDIASGINNLAGSVASDALSTAENNPSPEEETMSAGLSSNEPDISERNPNPLPEIETDTSNTGDIGSMAYNYPATTGLGKNRYGNYLSRYNL